MTTLLEKVLAQVSQLPDAEQDAVVARLLQTLTEFERENKESKEKPHTQFGSSAVRRGCLLYCLALMSLPDFEGWSIGDTLERVRQDEQYEGARHDRFGKNKNAGSQSVRL